MWMQCKLEKLLVDKYTHTLTLYIFVAYNLAGNHFNFVSQVLYNITHKEKGS
jgi:hypothetical protein